MTFNSYLTVSSRLDYCNSLLCNTTERNLNKLQHIQNTLAPWHILPVNLFIHPVLVASGSHYIGYQLDNVLFTKLLWLHIKLWKRDNWFIFVTCFIVIKQLVLCDLQSTTTLLAGNKDQLPMQGIQHDCTSCLEPSFSSYKKFHYYHHF